MKNSAPQITAGQLRNQQYNEASKLVLALAGLLLVVTIGATFWAGKDQITCIWIAFSENPKALVAFATLAMASGFLLLYWFIKNENQNRHFNQ